MFTQFKYRPTQFRVKNLVSNNKGTIPACKEDQYLVNPWGIVIDDRTLWVNSNGNGVLLNYDLNGNKLQNNIGTDPALTGIVKNNTHGFRSSNANNDTYPSRFIMATEQGNVDIYNRKINTSLVNMYAFADNVFKGIAIVDEFIYAPDFISGTVNVLDTNFRLQSGYAFTDPLPITPPTGFGFYPFNIVNICDSLYVSYALRALPSGTDDTPGAGNGYINVFDKFGNFKKTLITGGALNSPWAMVVVPKEFGFYGCQTLLVGNFGDGTINAFDMNGKYLGTLADELGNIIVIDGLWGLAYDDCTNSLYFTSGPNEEANGLLGVINKVGRCDCRY